MKPSITLQMKGIHGVLEYAKGGETYSIPAEFTGDYSSGLLLFLDDLDAQLDCPEPEKKKSELLRDLQAWSKESGTALTW
jgi:hypothetical protein